MPMIIELEALLFDRKMRNTDIIKATGHTPANVSKFRNGKVKSIRLSTLYRMCMALECQPGDIVKIVSEDELARLRESRAQAAARRLQAGIDQPVEPERVYVVEIEEDQ